MSRNSQISILLFACIVSSILTWALTTQCDYNHFNELVVAENKRQVMQATRVNFILLSIARKTFQPISKLLPIIWRFEGYLIIFCQPMLVCPLERLSEEK